MSTRLIYYLNTTNVLHSDVTQLNVITIMCRGTTFWSKACRNTKVQNFKPKAYHTVHGFWAPAVSVLGHARVKWLRFSGAYSFRIQCYTALLSPINAKLTSGIGVNSGESSFPFLHVYAINIRGHESYIYRYTYKCTRRPSVYRFLSARGIRFWISKAKETALLHLKRTREQFWLKGNGYESRWLSASLIPFAASLAKPL